MTGKKAFVKDAVISARIEGVNLFTEYNTMVVPVISEQEEQLDDIDKKLSKGFGTAAGKEEMLSAPYFGKPMQVSIHMYNCTILYNKCMKPKFFLLRDIIVIYCFHVCIGECLVRISQNGN